MANFNVYAASKRPYWTVRKNIMPEMNRRFCDHLYGAHYKLNISIYLNRTEITDIDHLTAEVAKRHLENDKRTLDLFEKAISVNNAFTVENLAGTCKYDVSLGKLLPAHLLKHDLQEKADILLKTSDKEKALGLLKEMGVLIRQYNGPIYKFRSNFTIGWPLDEVNELAKSWFGALIKKALDSKVQLYFNRSNITKPEDLALKIFDRRLADDGRTLGLFKKSIYVTGVVAFENAEKPFNFMLNLAFLTPAHLKNNSVKDKEIDDIIDGSDYRKTIEILYRLRALEIENKNKKPDKDKFLLRVVPDLFYPE